MAKKRMFSPTIIESDAFSEMDFAAQVLYIHLCINADDDGFVSNPKKIMRGIGIMDESVLELLLQYGFIFRFPDGIICIKHWLIHNSIPKDRYTPTTYQDNFRQLGVKKNKSYTTDESQMEYRCGGAKSTVEERKTKPYSTVDRKNRFNNFEQRKYDLEDLEKKLL